MEKLKAKCHHCNEVFEVFEENQEITCPCCKKVIDSADAIHLYNKVTDDESITLSLDTILPLYELSIKDETKALIEIKEDSLDALRALLNKSMLERNYEQAYLYAKKILKLFPKNYDGKIKLEYIQHLLTNYKIKKTGNASGVSFSTLVDESKAFYKYKSSYYNILRKRIDSKEGKNGYIYLIDIIKFESEQFNVWLESQKSDFRHGHRCFTYGRLIEQFVALVANFKDTDTELNNLYFDLNKLALQFYYIGFKIRGANKAKYWIKNKLKSNYQILLGKLRFVFPDYKGTFAELPSYTSKQALWREKCYKARKAIFFSIIDLIVVLGLVFCAFYFKYYWIFIPAGVLFAGGIFTIILAAKKMKKI